MKIRVLLVDDEQQFLEQLAERLKLREYDVSTCLNGEEALEKVRKYNFDVCILDVAMPGLDGIETLREIKRLNPLIEVIMLTGHATVESAIEGMKLGAFDYLLKPTQTDDLVIKIETANKRKAKQEKRILQAKVKEIVLSPRAVLTK
jgi:DNA-binding NtrC family response regulator